MTAVHDTDVPLPLLRRGKVREVYEVDDTRLLMVASDRISAFDVILNEPVADKGAVLTQISAFWFRTLRAAAPHHCLASDADAIVAAVPALAGHRSALAGRAMLCLRTEPVLFECVIRGYLSGSAWKEYTATGTLAGEPLAPGLRESDRFDPPVFSPATKADTGHDENIPYAAVERALGMVLARQLKDRSLSLYQEAQEYAAARGIIIADTKFEFGLDPQGRLVLIDEVLTPDSSRFWPADRYAPGRGQPSFDKQPVRDYLTGVKQQGGWNGEAPPPPLPAEVVRSTCDRYRDIFRRLTGHPLEVR
jgi:phosphoribosylaminoimidazole-succinocarboxamide synthase